MEPSPKTNFDNFPSLRFLVRGSVSSASKKKHIAVGRCGCWLCFVHRCTSPPCPATKGGAVSWPKKDMKSWWNSMVIWKSEHAFSFTCTCFHGFFIQFFVSTMHSIFLLAVEIHLIWKTSDSFHHPVKIGYIEGTPGKAQGKTTIFYRWLKWFWDIHHMRQGLSWTCQDFQFLSNEKTSLFLQLEHEMAQNKPKPQMSFLLVSYKWHPHFESSNLPKQLNASPSFETPLEHRIESSFGPFFELSSHDFPTSYESHIQLNTPKIININTHQRKFALHQPIFSVLKTLWSLRQKDIRNGFGWTFLSWPLVTPLQMPVTTRMTWHF